MRGDPAPPPDRVTSLVGADDNGPGEAWKGRHMGNPSSGWMRLGSVDRRGRGLNTQRIGVATILSERLWWGRSSE